MFHKILVAVDRSATSRQAFEAALSLAKPTGSSLVLLHILSLDDEESPHVPILFGKDFYASGASHSVIQIYEKLWQAYEERGRALLQSLVDEAIAHGIATEFTQGIGSPGSIICEFAHRTGVDLIVMGRHGYSGLNEWLLGSVSNYVLHHAPCSVLIIHQPKSAADTIPDHAIATIS